MITSCCRDGARGAPVAELLLPLLEHPELTAIRTAAINTRARIVDLPAGVGHGSGSRYSGLGITLAMRAPVRKVCLAKCLCFHRAAVHE